VLFKIHRGEMKLRTYPLHFLIKLTKNMD
jgi:hypothetical protein